MMARPRWPVVAVAGLGVGALAAVLTLVVCDGTFVSFTPDSWSYLELARSVGADPGRVATVRQFTVAPFAYGCSFPPLWPCLMALAGAVLPLGVHVGVAVNLLLLALSLVPLAGLARVALPERPVLALGASFAAWAWMLADRPLMAEALAGRSLPLALVLLLTAVWAVASSWEKRPLARAACLGAAVGLACLTRFDVNVLALGLVLVAALRAPAGLRARAAVVYCGLVVLAVSPWVTYSMVRFGVPYVSDNGWVAAAAANVHVSQYEPPVPTVRQEPGLWLGKVGGNLVRTVRLGWRRFASSLLRVVVAVAAVVWGLGRLLGRVRPVGPSDPSARALAVVCGLLPLLATGPVLTGYMAPRYLSAPLLLLPVAALVALAGRIPRGRPALALALVLGVAASCDVLAEVDAAVASGWGRAPEPGSVRAWAFRAAPWTEPAMAGLARALGPGAVVLEGRGECGLGVATGVATVIIPSNWAHLGAERRRAFLARFRVTHVMLGEGEPPEGLGLGSCSFEPAWRGAGGRVYRLSVMP